MKEKLTGADYLLLLLSLKNNQPIIGSVRLTKMMFLFDKEIAPIIKKKNFEVGEIKFIAYDFGPFSEDVYEQIELFSTIGFLDKEEMVSDDNFGELDDWQEQYNEELNQGYRKLNTNYVTAKYSLTDKGVNYVAEKILPQINDEIIEILTAFKTKITSLSMKNILIYVYTRYPDFTTKSLIKKQVLGEVVNIINDEETESSQ